MLTNRPPLQQFSSTPEPTSFCFPTPLSVVHKQRSKSVKRCCEARWQLGSRFQVEWKDVRRPGKLRSATTRQVTENTLFSFLIAKCSQSSGFLGRQAHCEGRKQLFSYCIEKRTVVVCNRLHPPPPSSASLLFFLLVCLLFNYYCCVSCISLHTYIYIISFFFGFVICVALR